MRIPRFIDFLVEVLTAVEVGKVEPFWIDGFSQAAGVKVTPADGSRPLYFRITRTSGPGGDNFGDPEAIPYPEYVLPLDLKERTH